MKVEYVSKNYYTVFRYVMAITSFTRYREHHLRSMIKKKQKQTQVAGQAHQRTSELKKMT